VYDGKQATSEYQRGVLNHRVDEYANRVTYARLAGLPIG